MSLEGDAVDAVSHFGTQQVFTVLFKKKLMLAIRSWKHKLPDDTQYIYI